MNSPLAKNFNLAELIKFTLPSIFTAIFMSTYMIIDGIFVATLVGEKALAAVNLITPVFGIVLAVGFMFSSGGNAVIAKFLGQGKHKEAKEFLTVIYILGGILGAILTTIIFMFPDQLLNLLNAEGDLYALAKDYLLSIAGFLVPLFLMAFAQGFMITAGNPTFGLVLSLAGGITNIVFDYVFISPNLLNLGIAGAGLATGAGYAVTGIIGFLYFIFNRKGILCFVKPKLDIKTLWQSMYNGSSELIGSLATSITGLMFNFILLSMVGDAGVAAISAILYIQMFQNAIYNGYIMGSSSIIAYKYGEENHQGLHKVILQSLKIITVTSVLVVAATIIFSEQAIGIFISKDSTTFDMAKNGLLLFLPAYLFMGFNLFFSSMFTALSNGKVSAIISVLRSLAFIIIALVLLPQILGLDGVWLAVPVAEFLAILVSIFYYKKNKQKYNY